MYQRKENLAWDKPKNVRMVYIIKYINRLEDLFSICWTMFLLKFYFQ